MHTWLSVLCLLCLSTVQLCHSLGLGINPHDLANKLRNVENLKEAVEDGPNGDRIRPLMSRYGSIGVRSLRQMSSPLLDMSSIMLPLEQRAMWRNIAPPKLRSSTDVSKYYNRVNPVLYDMLVN